MTLSASVNVVLASALSSPYSLNSSGIVYVGKLFLRLLKPVNVISALLSGLNHFPATFFAQSL